MPRRKLTGLEALMVNYPIFQLAAGMMASFGVLYVYLLGDGLMAGLGLVFLFFSLQRTVVGLVVPVITKVIGKLGYRWTIFVSLVFLILKTLVLMQMNQFNLWLIGPATFFGGIAIASYYMSYHGMFLTDNDDSKIGRQMGLVTMVGRMGVMMAPLLAGLLIQQYSYNVMFMVAIGLLVLSSFPLFLMPHHDHKKERFSIKEAFLLLKKKEGFLDSATWWHFENGLQSFWWPILLFLIAGSFAKFGMIGSGVMVANSVAVYFAGRLYDRRKLRKVYPVFTAVVAVSNAMRYSSNTLGMGIASDSLNRVASPFWWMKIRRNSLVDGENYEPMVFAAAWEWSACFGYLASLMVGYLILMFSNGQWQWLMVPAVIANIAAGVGVRKDEGGIRPLNKY
ncbi:MAG: MFS transporter [Candidatus Beckwithbacteria bacterium]|nr:MFS transporter [Patescibacteria group bacterium]